MPLTRAQFAEEIKRKFPQYQSVPDNQLVDAVLTKYPQYRGQVQEAQNPEAQKAPLPGGTLRQLLRPQNWTLEGVPETLGREVGATASTLNPVNWYQGMKAGMQSKDPRDVMLANLARGYGGPAAETVARSMAIPLLRSLSALGDYPKISLEQALSVAPEAVGQGAGQALMMRGPINKLAGTATPEPGPLLGTVTRARAALDRIETAHANTPVDPTPVIKIANRALQASQRGYTLPKPISDFIDHMTQPGQTLNIEAARDFSKALGENIPWDQPGAKAMNGFMKDMRGALEQETATALKNDPGAGPKVANEYLKAKLEFGRGQRFIESGREGGRVVGGALGYELGRKLGVGPFEGMAAGGLVGRKFFGPLTAGLAKQIAEPPILGRPIAETAGALSTARKAATPFAAPFTAPFRQPPPDEGEQ